MPNAKLLRAVLPASLAAALACSDPSANAPTAPTTRVPDGPQLITNGQPTGSAYGGVGVVLIDEGGDGTLDFLCSGSLISPTVLLTAGHCLGGPGTVYYVSFVPDVIPLPPASAFAVSTTAFASTADDIGVIILPAGSTTGIPVYDLPTLGLLDQLSERGGLARDRAVVVGYGEGRLQGMQTSSLDGVRKVTTAKIQSLVGSFIVLSGAEGESSHGSVCFGDSGGPMFLANGDPNTIVGVNDAVQHLGCQGHAVEVRLDTPTALAFLGQYVTP
jgi:trypsin